MLDNPYLLRLLIILTTLSYITIAQEKLISDNRLRYVYLYKRLNWCIAGRGEIPLYEWPLVQLKPFLLPQEPRSFRDNFESDEEMEKSKLVEPTDPVVSFKSIQCNESIEVNDILLEGGMRNRFHLTFKSNVKFQAMVIQAVHAPFGLGFPFGQFHLNDEYICGDCTHMIGKVLGCLSRPDFAPMVCN